MRKRVLRCTSFMWVIALALLVLLSNSAKIASAAAAPSISVSAKTIMGVNATFTVSLKNTGNSIKSLTWYTLNDDIATVEASRDPMTAKVTAEGKGTTYIKCKITYKSGKVARPACKVTVKIPATKVEITNAQDDEENNYRHVIAVGEKYDFNRTITPSDASVNIYWILDDDGSDYASVISNGTVTGLKPGFVRLTAVAAFSKGGAQTSKIRDSINIEIIPKTAEVKDVTLENATTLKVVFDRPINASTVIDTDDTILDSVTIIPKKDSNNQTANALGELTGSVSDDGKTLYIYTENSFNGLYSLGLSEAVKGTDGQALQKYYESLEFYDTTAPVYKDCTLDPTGLKVSINFTEPMDFSSMNIDSVTVKNSGTEVLAATLSMLGNESNYVKSNQGKSLSLDLTNMPTNDRNKTFTLKISNLKDVAGNTTKLDPITVSVKTDTTLKAQAKLLDITRTDYDTLTATFDRPIKRAGIVSVNYTDFLEGMIDSEDQTKVYYSLSANSVLLTGTQLVRIGYWDSYNVIESDTSANKMYEKKISFTIADKPPVLSGYVMTKQTVNSVSTNVITLTYDKKVTLTSSGGTFISSLVTTDNSVYSYKPLSYTAKADANTVSVYISNSQMSENGAYTITIPANFVKDSDKNMSLATSISLVNGSASGKLPAPYSILPLSGSPGTIDIYFAKKIDETTAKTLSNYSITGVSLESVTLMENSDTGARVRLTTQADAITASGIYSITIRGLKGYQDSYSVMNDYQSVVYLFENIEPTLISYGYTFPYKITYTFNEYISGTPSFRVIQNNTELTSTSVISGNSVIITLDSLPSFDGSPMIILPDQNNIIKDYAGNAVSVLQRYIVPKY